MKKLLIILLTFIVLICSCGFTIEQDDEVYPHYTIYIPDEPSELIVFFNTHYEIFATGLNNGKISKTKYNFHEDIINEIAIDNPNAIIITALQSNKVDLKEKIQKLINQYDIDDIVLSGWSIGGTDALALAGELIEDNSGIFINILLIDSHHINLLSTKTYEKMINNIKVYYLTNNVCKVKITKNSNLTQLIDFNFLQCDISNKDYFSTHSACRNCAFEDNVYGYILREEELEDNISIINLK